MKYVLSFLILVFTFITLISQNTLDLGRDTSICTNSGLKLTSNLIGPHIDYLWNTKEKTESILVDSTGEYSLIVSYTDSLITMFDSLITLYNTDTIFTDSTMMEVETIISDTTIIDSTFTIITYFDTLQVDTILIEIRNMPIPDFSSNIPCFPGITTISNNSHFNIGSTVEYTIQGFAPFNNIEESIPIFLNKNGETRNVKVVISQENGCSTTSSFIISNNRKPQGEFNLAATCENEAIDIINNSTFTYPETSIDVIYGSNFIESFNNTDLLQFDTLAEGTYPFKFILSNQNTCYDTIDYAFTILKTNYVAFTIEDNSGINKDDLNYCKLDPIQLLQSYDTETGINLSSGIFTHPYVLDNKNGTGYLELNNVDSNFDILYEYTNNLGCRDDYTLRINNIFPLPLVDFAGLKPEFCVYDDPINITANQDNGIFSILPTNQNVFEQINGTSATFNPMEVGTFILSYKVTDNNGCKSQITQQSIVHPLPIIDLPNEESLLPNTSITIGDPNPNMDVEYYWSTGESINQIEVESPGVYVVAAYNTVTTCEAFDTVTVSFIVGIENTIKDPIIVYPNPFGNSINIQFNDLNNSFIEVFDGTGKLRLKDRILSSDLSIIDTGELEKGVYYLRIGENCYKLIKM